MVKQIPLTQGKFALVDDEDFEELNKYKWHVLCVGRGNKKQWYATRKAGPKRKTILMHRYLMNAPSDILVDHKNRNGIDNRRENLRFCNHSQNKQNRERQANNTSGYKGVWWNKHLGKWASSITIDEKTKHLGRFNTSEEAARAYDDAILEYYGEFAHTNAMAGLL